MFIVNSVVQLEEAIRFGAKEIIVTGELVEKVKTPLLNNNLNLIVDEPIRFSIISLSPTYNVNLIENNNYSCLLVTVKNKQAVRA